MSKLSSFDTKTSKKSTPVKNHMDGISFVPNSALLELKLIANSSIFGEPNFYTPSCITSQNTLKKYDSIFDNFLKRKEGEVDFSTKTITTEMFFEDAIDRALTSDFGATLQYAVELRNVMNMRLNPSVIVVRALMHPSRQAFNEANPGVFADALSNILKRADDVKNQFEYFVYLNKSKNKLPSFIKRGWGKYLSSLTAYEVAKYKETGKLIDMVRISHANSELINELMTTGTVRTSEEEKTWEVLRSNKMTWSEILEKTYIPHMALLRNLRNIFSEISDVKTTEKILNMLKKGVAKGKQFPFRYYSAYKEILASSEVHNKTIVLDALNECIELAIKETPKMKGKTISLCDNSGSAWGAFTTTHSESSMMNGTAVATIANLSGIMTAKNSEDGYIGVFGDNLKIKPVLKSAAVFEELATAEKDGKAQGGGTENGMWIFFRDAIENKDHWDNIFIYSDQQAGHGGLYGKKPDTYSDFIYEKTGNRFDLVKMIEKYRKEVNPFVNIISIQVAGYNNSVLPENMYRSAILSGWTGKEVDFAYNMAKIWDEVDLQNGKKTLKNESALNIKTSKPRKKKES